MKKLLLLGALAVGLTLTATAGKAEANHPRGGFGRGGVSIHLGGGRSFYGHRHRGLYGAPRGGFYGAPRGGFYGGHPHHWGHRRGFMAPIPRGGFYGRGVGFIDPYCW